jgi:hypothetical protein
MTEPEEGRPGGPATPTPADPAAPVQPGSEARADDTVVIPPVAVTPDPAPSPAPAPAPPPSPSPTPPHAPAPTPSPTPPHAPPPSPSPTPAPAPAPSPSQAQAPVATAARPEYADDEADDEADDDDDYDDDYDELDDLAPRWVGLVTTAGAGIIGVIALQVVMALVEGLTTKKAERLGVPDDLFHRIGYPFGGIGPTVVFLALLGVALLVLPSILGEPVTDRQYAIAGAALRTVIAIGVIIGLGSILAIRGSLHEFSAKNVSVPAYTRMQFTGFLLATLASSALAITGAVTALRVRDES